MRIIDTDILIDHFHGNRFALDYLRDCIDTEETLAISVITVTEILAGLRPGEEVKTNELLGLFLVLDVDEWIARRAGEYLNQYRISHRIDLGDAVIAATVAKHSGSNLVTRNLKHYPMKDFSIVEPYQRG